MASPHETVDKVVSWITTAQMLRSGALVATFIFAVCNRKLWFGVDMIASALFGLAWIVVPGHLLEFQIARQTVDGVDLELGRMMGCVLLGNSVLWFLLTKFTRDPDTVHPTLLLTRVISLGVLIIAMIDIQLFSKAWGAEHMTFGILGASLWLAGNLFHLLSGGYPGGHMQRDRPMNNFLLFDFAVSVFAGFTLYGFPRWFLRNFTLIRSLDGVHEHMTRAFGVLIFGTGLFALQAVGFLDDRDKEAHFIQRGLINLGLFVCTLYVQFFYQKEWNLVHCWAIQFALILWSIHAYLGWKANPYLRVPYKPKTGVATRSGIGRKLIPDYGDYDRSE